ncbi:MAG TPA: hypothetical protein VM580_06220 [Labilithrix sp.]|jgi:hypothetical protein|nr:hypothetical protein [Labilithrix sp.]
MRVLFAAVACSSSLALLGCPAMNQSPGARAQEAVTDLNAHARFGRMEIAAERVAPSSREAFLARRKAWGGNLRVADYELAGFHMKGASDAETLVKVAWYRIDEGDLHTTVLKQKWHAFKGDWQLVDEERADGDAGLIGEPVEPKNAGKPERKSSRFPTIYLGTGSVNAPADEATIDAPVPPGASQSPSPEPATPAGPTGPAAPK